MAITRILATGAAALADLVDLVLPADCAGCGAPGQRSGVCGDCAAMLAQPPGPARPSPVPSGLPPCFATGEYGGVLRELILAYKERGRRSLAGPLGDALARTVLAAWPVRLSAVAPLALVPVPGTAASIRARHGDHMLRLARRAASTLRSAGAEAFVARPLRALPKHDSAHLDRVQRAAAARSAFALRPGQAQPLRAVADAAAVVLLDDVLTTGATLASVAHQLLSAGVPAAFAVTLAATRLRRRTDYM